MHVVLGGTIIIWTLYALITSMSVACMSTSDKVKWELVFDAMPDDEPFVQLARQMSRRFRQNKRMEYVQGYGGVGQEMRVNVQAARGKCDCTLENRLKSLGDHRYPNVLMEYACRNSSWCKPLNYKVTVLTKQQDQGCSSPDNSNNSEYIVDGLPYELVRNKWRFVEVDVTVGCTCTTAT